MSAKAVGTSAQHSRELDQRFVWSSILPPAVLKCQRRRAEQTQTSRVLWAVTLHTAGWSHLLMVMLCLVQPKVGVGLWATRAHTLLTQTEPAAGPFLGTHDLGRMWTSMNASRRGKKKKGGERARSNVLCGAPVTFCLVWSGERSLMDNLTALCSNLRKGRGDGDAELLSLNSSEWCIGIIQSCAKKGLDWSLWNNTNQEI